MQRAARARVAAAQVWGLVHAWAACARLGPRTTWARARRGPVHGGSPAHVRGGAFACLQEVPFCRHVRARWWVPWARALAACVG